MSDVQNSSSNFEFSPSSVELYSQEYQQYIEIEEDRLPPNAELASILVSERVTLDNWVQVALMYYNRGRLMDFLALMKASEKIEFRDYDDKIWDELKRVDKLGGYYLNLALKSRLANSAVDEVRVSTNSDAMTMASRFFSQGDKIALYECNHITYRTIFSVISGRNAAEQLAQLGYVTKINPNCGLAFLVLGAVHQSLRNYETALSMFRQGFELSPFLCGANIRIRIGYCFAKLKQHAKAKRVFHNLIKLDKNCAKAHAALGLIASDIKSNRESAMVHFKAAYRADSTHLISLLHLSDYFYLTDQASESLKLATAATIYARKKQQRAEASYLCARAFHELGKFDEAFENYRQSYIFGGDKFSCALMGMAQMSLRRNEFDLCVKYLTTILEFEPRCLDTQRLLGLVYAHLGSEEKREIARKFLQNAISGFPEDFEILSTLYDLEQDDKKLSHEYIDRAIGVLHKAGTDELITADLWNNLAVAEFEVGLFRKASSSFLEALRVCVAREPDRATRSMRIVQFSYGYARSLEASSNFEDAVHVYKLIRSLCPSYTNAALRLAAIACVRRRRSEAVDYLKAALKLDPDNKDIWIMFGNMHMAANELGPAQKTYEKAMTLADAKSLLTEKHKKRRTFDIYANLAMANIWLNSLNVRNPDTRQVERHAARALDIYSKILREQPKCIIAVNGVACLLAHKRQSNGARFLFGLVKHNKPDYRDAYMNMATFFCADKQFEMALNNYVAIEKTFRRQVNPKSFMTIAKTYTKENQYHEADISLKRGIRKFPNDRVLPMYLASNWLLHSTNILRKKKRSSAYIERAVERLNDSKAIFENVLRNRTKVVNKEIVDQAARRLKRCDETLKHSTRLLDKVGGYEETEKERLKRKYENFSQQALEQLEAKKEKERLENESRQKQETARQVITEQMAKRWAQMALTRKMIDGQKKKNKRGGSRKQKKRPSDSNPHSSANEDDELLDSARKPKKIRRSKKGHSDSTDAIVESQTEANKVYKSKAFISSEDSDNSVSQEPQQQQQHQQQQLDTVSEIAAAAEQPASPPTQPANDPARKAIISDDEGSESNGADNRFETFSPSSSSTDSALR